MRRIILLVLIGLSSALFLQLKAQVPAQDIGKQYFEMGEFFRWGHNLKGRSDSTKAVTSYKKSADLNYPDGIMAMGEMYQEGRGGLKKDVQKGFDLIMKAYKLGSGRACYDLGRSYAYGLGCEVDYTKMISYFNDGIKKGDPSSMYGMGNLLYKGWGVEQSYKKAIVLFEKAASLGNASSNYYLGVCYRNGYGVPKNEQKGKVYLDKAAKMCSFSRKELKENIPEIDHTKKIGGKDYDSPKNHSKVKHNAKIESFAGVWVGHIALYDWSGKFKLNEDRIELNIKIDGDKFEGTGNLKGEPINIKGFDNQYGIVFSSGEYNYIDHFMGKVRLKINSGSFESFTQDRKSILAGNISLFSITEKAPERPAYIVLTRKDEDKLPKKNDEKTPLKSALLSNLPIAKDELQPSKNLIVNKKDLIVVSKNDSIQSPSIVSRDVQSQEEQIVNHLQGNTINSRVWPNPFMNQINVEYNLLTDGEVEIRLISIDGKLMRVLSKENRPAGLQTQQFEVAVTNGTYILQIISNSMKASHKVMRQY